MPDNPQALPGRAFALPGHHLIALEGRDAAAFAQAQFMNDVKALADGHWQWSGWLTPKGRVIALFALLRLSEDTVWLLLPDPDAAAMAASLKRFVFRSKLTIALRDDLVTIASFNAPIQASAARIGGDVAGGVELDMSGDGGARSLRIVAGPAGDDDAAAAAQWALADLRHGLPRLPPSQAEQWTPQQLSLDRLRAFSVKKGCYPGQEIVARTHFLGKAKRWLALYQCPTPVAVGAAVVAGADTIGTIVASSGEWAQAVINQEHPQTEQRAADTVLHPRDFNAGLER